MADTTEDTARRLATVARRASEIMPAESYRSRDELSTALESARSLLGRVGTLSEQNMELIQRGARVSGIGLAGVGGGLSNGTIRRLIEHFGRNPNIGGMNADGTPKLPISYAGALGAATLVVSIFAGEDRLGTVGTDVVAAFGVGLMAPDAAEAGYTLTSMILTEIAKRSAPVTA